MADPRYRSYVIRVRRQGHPDAGPTRLDVEDLLDGGHATVSGERASSLADSLERLVGPASQPPEQPGVPGPATGEPPQ